MTTLTAWLVKRACALLPGLLSAWAIACLINAASAETWPSRAVRLVVPQAAGGTTDVLARAISERLSLKWSQPVFVVNTVGAAGNIGTQQVATAAADGYTLLVTYEGSQAINPSLYVKLGFDPIKDFQPVATLAQSAFFVICDPKLPINSLQDLIAYAKARPDPINYATSGVGSVNHLIGEMIRSRASVPMVHVPFRGVAEAISGIIGGHVQAGIASLPSVIGQVRAGTVRALAISSSKRAMVAPDVPTIAESGIAGFDVNPWWGILAPARTDMAIVRKINADIAELLMDPEMGAFLTRQGAERFASTPEVFQKALEANVAMWAKVVADAGLKPQ